MAIIYTFIMSLFTPFIVIHLWWRTRHQSKQSLVTYKNRWPELFGRFSARPLAKGLWLHAVSLGEVNAAIPLIKILQSLYPKLNITVTTTTATGSARVQEAFGAQVFHVYAPLELPSSINRFLQQIDPVLAIFM